MSKEGWLEREVSWAVFNPWQRRYFVLRDNLLSWHDDPTSVSERGKGKAIPWDIGKCVLTNREDVENCFMIHLTTDGRTLLVKAESAEEKNRWMEALKPLHNGSSTFDVITRHVCDAVLVDMTAEVEVHPRQDRFQGAMLFTDISGFTALSERLRAESGQQGCERLNGIINAFFDQIIKICLGYGGDVVKFAGDAMFVVFRANHDLPEDDGARLTACTVRAACCAVDVMALDGQTVDCCGAAMPLRLHCGIGAGQMTGMTVGTTSGADGRFEYVVGGDPLPQITLTDKLAEAGEVLVAPEAWAYVVAGGDAHGLSVKIVESGCALLLGFAAPAKVRALSASSATSSAGHRPPAADAAVLRDRGSTRSLSHRSASLGEGELPQETRAKLLRDLRESDPEKVERVLNNIVHRFIPASVQQMIEVESTMDPSKRMHTHWAATQRTVTIMFVRLAGAETNHVQAGDEPPTPLLSELERLDLAVCIMQKALFQFEGAVSRLQIDDKGTVLKAAFGLPPHFHHNDPARAILAALLIEENLHENGMGCTIGITTGDIFCGMVGNSDRCEYTTVGAEVNLAARLMMVAGGPEGQRGILCDERTYSRSRESTMGQARFDGPESHVVKKRKDPLIAYRPHRARTLARLGSWDKERAAKLSNPLVGRDRQLQQLRAELKQMIDSSAGSGSNHGSRLIVVEGDTGMGKTRLLRALAESLEAKVLGENNCLLATAQWWSKDTPLHAFQPLFYRILQATVAATFGSEADKRSAVAQAGKATPRDRGGRTPGATRIPSVLARHKTQSKLEQAGGDGQTSSQLGREETTNGENSTDDESEHRHRRHMTRAVRLLLSNDRTRQARISSAGISRRSNLAERRTTSLRHVLATSSVCLSGPANSIVSPGNSIGWNPATTTAVNRSVSLASPRFNHQHMPGARTPRRTASVANAHGPESSSTSTVDPNIDVLNDFMPVHFDECPTTATSKPAERLNTAILYMAQLLRAHVALGLRDTDASRPALLLIENGQDLDSASLRLISTLLDSIPHLLVVVATRQWRPQRAASGKGLAKTGGVRSTSTDARGSSRRLSFGALTQRTFRSSSLAEWLMARASAAAIVTLESLSEDDIAQIATNFLGVQGIPSALKEALHRKSHGNPYFAEQLLQTWVESGELTIAGGLVRFMPRDSDVEQSNTAVAGQSTLPVGVQQVIMERIERLSWSQQITLRAASVVDGTFNIEMLKRMHSRLHELGNDDICLDLQQLCELDLLEEVTEQQRGDGTDVLRVRRPRGHVLQQTVSVSLMPSHVTTASRYEENDRFEGNLRDSSWQFKSPTVRQTVYKVLSKSQLKAAHWEVARYREENLMKKVERRCRRHSSFARTGSSPLSTRVIEEAREALKVMAARPITNLTIQGATVSAVDTDGEQQNCVRIEFRRTGVGALLDHWERQTIMLAVDSVEEQEEWRVSILRAQEMAPFGGDVQYAERLKQGWLNRAEGKQGHGKWTREWFALLPGRLLSYKEPPALMLPQLNHYNAFRMSDNLPSLAEHFIQAEDMDNAIKYLNYAGIMALENDQIGESVTSFSKATKLEQARARKRTESGVAVQETLQPEQRARLERLKAEAYVSAGPEHPSSAPKALAHLTKALDLLGQPISQLVEQRKETAWTFSQLEPWFQAWPDSPDVVTPDDQVDIIRCHLLLFELTRLNSSELCCRVMDAYAAAHFALTLSLNHYDPELVSMSIAACCVATCSQGWHTASARLAHAACQALVLCTGIRCAAQVQLLIAEYNVAHCSWTEAAECFEEAYDILVDLGDDWRAGIAKDGLRWVEHIQTNYYEMDMTSMEPGDGPTVVATEDEPDSSRTSGSGGVASETGGPADHYAIVEQVSTVRRAWSALQACAATSSSRSQLCAKLGNLFPAEFMLDLLDNQLGRNSHGLSGLLALCAAELAAIYACWLMENASLCQEQSGSPVGAGAIGATSVGQLSDTDRQNRQAQARAESFRILVLASGLTDGLTFPTARALPALIAVSQGWLRFVERWGAGKQRKRRHRRHSVDHSLMSQPPPSPVASTRGQLGETPAVKALGTSARSLDADDSVGATPDRMSELSDTHSTAKKPRRSKRESARRLSVPDWHTHDGVHTGSRMISPLTLHADRATHHGVTSTAHSSGGLVVELELPTRIPIPVRRRGDSGGSSASGSDATPLVGTVSRAPPPPSPLPRAETPTGTPAATRDGPGHAETGGSEIGSLLPPLQQTVSSVTTQQVHSENEKTKPTAVLLRSSSSAAGKEEAAVAAVTPPDERHLRTSSVRNPPLASILSVDGDTASSSEDEMPSVPVTSAQPAESPLLLRLRSEIDSDDNGEDDEIDTVLNRLPAAQPEPEPEPELELDPESKLESRSGWSSGPHTSAHIANHATPGRHARSASTAAAMHQAREALLQQIASAGDHVQHLLTYLTEYRGIFPVCQPNADLLELQALQQQQQGGSSQGFDLESDIHHAMDIASRAIWTAAVHCMPTERQAAMNAAASLLLRSEPTHAWLVADGRIGANEPTQIAMARSSPASSFSSTPGLSVSVASPFVTHSPYKR